ncbi:hypothetical protein TNCV_2790471 [Trichonephila clavipes]|nr:hypothetical protein TNCV_2790471 [Trichonephila clavipes]
MILGVGPVCLGHRQLGCRRVPGLLLTNTRSSLAPRQNLLSSENTKKPPLRSSMSSDLTPLPSQTVMVWSHWNTRYRTPGSELFLKLPISNSSLCYGCTNFSSNFCRRRSTLRHSRTPNSRSYLPSQ